VLFPNDATRSIAVDQFAADGISEARRVAGPYGVNVARS
jgi:hypothetical protein